VKELEDFSEELEFCLLKVGVARPTETLDDISA
jgi:hypothetical protein